jgi:mannitol-1-phosphate 5-dehydrogenase
LKEQGLKYKTLLETAALIFNYNDNEDAESVQLQMMLKEKRLERSCKNSHRIRG